jgi:hypothetical protein
MALTARGSESLALLATNVSLGGGILCERSGHDFDTPHISGKTFPEIKLCGGKRTGVDDHSQQDSVDIRHPLKEIGDTHVLKPIIQDIVDTSLS